MLAPRLFRQKHASFIDEALLLTDFLSYRKREALPGDLNGSFTCFIVVNTVRTKAMLACLVAMKLATSIARHTLVECSTDNKWVTLYI